MLTFPISGKLNMSESSEMLMESDEVEFCKACFIHTGKWRNAGRASIATDCSLLQTDCAAFKAL